MIIFLSFSEINLSEARREFREKFTDSQINLSEERGHIFNNTKAHHAQKDISKALEQIYSSEKKISEAWRVILTSHDIILALSNRCV